MMFGGLESFLPAFDLSGVAPALGLLSVGVWLLRLQRVAAYIRLAGLLSVLVAGVLVVGGVSGVVRLDMHALARLVEASTRLGGDALRVLLDVLAGGGA